MSWWTDNPLIYQLCISSTLGALWIFLIALTLKGRMVRWTFYWFLAPSFLLFGLRSWDSIPAVFTALSTILLTAGMIRWSALALALASSSSFYPSLLLPIYLLKTGKGKRLIFLLVFLLSFMFVNFPFEVVNPERWLNSYTTNVVDVVSKGAIQHFLSFTSQPQLIYTLSTTLFFIAGYALMLYKGNGKSPHQLVLTVLTFFLLVNGIYAPTTNLWLSPLVGLAQPNPVLFFSFDLISVLISVLQPLSVFGIQFLELFIARTVLLALLLVHLWTLSPPKTSSLTQCVDAIAVKLGEKWEEFKGRLTETPTPIILLLLGTLASVTLLSGLGNPDSVYFDEEHYVTAARSILGGGGDPNFIHPPLGKLLMALGMLALGESNPLGWRLPGVLLAILSVPALDLIGTRLYGSRKTGLIASLLLCFDFLFFAQARIAMLDIYVLAFSLFGVLFYLSSNRSHRLSYLALSGVFFGMAVSSKISGVLPLLLCFIHGVIRWGRGRKRNALLLLTTLILIPIAVYIASYIPCFFILGHSFGDFLNRQYQMLHYSAYLPGTHPYMSEPWTWPLMIRPLLSLYETLQVNEVTYVATISHLGNPLVWHIGIVLIAISTWNALRRGEGESIFACAWFLFTWLFYFPTGIAHALFGWGRAQYIYYFLQSVPALCLVLANALGEGDEAMRFPVSALALAACLLTFALCYPVISGYSVPLDYVQGVKLTRLGV
jgi:predicted membrane-bound dolichyl-phosphate-mannose-protein mannosyltransferase